MASPKRNSGNVLDENTRNKRSPSIQGVGGPSPSVNAGLARNQMQADRAAMQENVKRTAELEKQHKKVKAATIIKTAAGIAAGAVAGNLAGKAAHKAYYGKGAGKHTAPGNRATSSTSARLSGTLAGATMGGIPLSAAINAIPGKATRQYNRNIRTARRANGR